MHSIHASRRTFLRYLAASPLLGGASRAFGQFDFTVTDTLISDPSEAVNVFDFEPVARRNLSLAHYTYLASGVDDGSTINRVMRVCRCRIVDNPPVSSEISAPPDVRRVLEESCFDCHSNQTEWPWYSHLAPASWLVAVK